MRCTLLGGLCVFCLLLTISIIIILFSQSKCQISIQVDLFFV